MNSFLKKYFDRMVVKTILITMMISLTTGWTLFSFHTDAQQEMLSHEIYSQSKAAGHSIANFIESVLDLDIPFDSLVRANDYLNGNLKNAKQLDYIAITDSAGHVLYNTDGFESAIKGSFKRFALNAYDDDKELPSFNVNKYRDIPLRITHQSNLLGYLHLGVSKKLTNSYINDIYYDILTILFVSLVIGFEFLTFLFRNSVTVPFTSLIESIERIIHSDYREIANVKGKDSISQLTRNLNLIILKIVDKFKNLSDRVQKIKEKHKGNNDRLLVVNETFENIANKRDFPEQGCIEQAIKPIVENLRLPIFLVVLAETVLITLLPSYAAQFYEPTFMFSKQFISSSPILVFTIFAAMSVPLSAPLSYRIGFQKTLMTGALISALGYILCFPTHSLALLLVSRAITAFGYGLTYSAFQNYIAAYSSDDRRIQSYAIFAIALASAYICGVPIGGILVDNIGYNFTFLLAGCISLSALLIALMYVYDFKSHTLTEQRATKKKPSEILKNSEFLSLAVLSVLPARFAFTSLIWFLSPVFLRSLGNSQSSTGRIIMIFGVISFLVSPLAARFVEKSKGSLITLWFSSFGISLSLLVYGLFESTLGAMVGLVIYAFSSVVHVCVSMSILEKISVKESENYRKSTILSFYIIFERFGMIMGPAVASVFLNYLDFEWTFIAMGAFVLVLNVIYITSHLYMKHSTFLSVNKDKIS